VVARVAVDVLGGDDAPTVVLDGAAAALRADADLELVLVGPPELIGNSPVHEADLRKRVVCVPAHEVIGMGEQPARAVRAKRDASVVTAMRVLRDEGADAVVSAGSTGATMAAAVTVLGRLPGFSRPALAAVLPAPVAPVVLLDVGANPGASAELLVQFALAGVSFARVRLGLEIPRVGLLNVGTEPGKGDAVRRAVEPRLEQALLGEPATFVGNVEADAVALGGIADVVVTDGFTGNVLIKGIEATIDAILGVVGDESTRRSRDLLRPMRPEQQAGAVLLGVDGVVVVGHGASGAAAVEGCIRGAAEAVRGRLLPRVRDVLGRMSVLSKTAAGVAMRGGEG
jgi:glycerol-3-phosphate acyltransferase PlsX